jgi:V8-like Glu-specific endopeptidase
VQSNELWSGRILPVGCTGSVYCNTGSGMVTAGHCLDGQGNMVVQFNVPNSNGDCSLNNPPVADQFPVLPGFQFQNAGPGNDWGVYLTGTNNLGQTPFQRYGQFRPLAAAPAGNGATTNFWGYGVDTNCVRSQTQQFSTGPITAVNGDYYDFSADVRGGNSGSGYLNANNEIIGIVTHCRVGCPNVSQRVDDAAFVAGRNAVNPNCAGAPPQTPANDNCANAQIIGVGSWPGDTTLATNDGTASCGASATSPDVWYRFQSNCAGTFRFSTCGTTSFDTVLSFHSACGGAQIACLDDFCGLQTQLDLVAAANTPYWVRVAGFDGTRGAFTLNVTSLNTTPPANDSCASPQVIGLGAVSGTNVCATTDAVTTCGFNTQNDVWYSFTPSCTGTHSFDTCGPRTFDTVLSVLSGCGTSPIACNDDFCDLSSTVSATLTAGTPYLIRVAGYNGQSGTFTLNATAVNSTPVNDNCGNATLIGIGSVTGSTVCATNDGSANCAASGSSPDVWYAFRPTCGGIYQFDTLGNSDYDTALSIHTGCPGTIANQIACDDDSAGFPLSLIRVSLLANTTYYIRVNGFFNRTGNYQLNVSEYKGNDSCANAFRLANGTTGFNNLGATTDGSPEGICNAFGDNNVGSDIWYIYQATCNGTVEINSCGSGFDTKIAVYNNASCPVTGPIVCNDDSCGLQSRVVFNATAGSVYRVRVGGFLARQGCGVLNVSCNTACPWQADGCFADYNNDGGIDGDDVIAFFSDWDSAGICADVNGDEGVDGDDVILFFNSWDQGGTGFPGC